MEAAAACGAIESHLLTATGRTQHVRYVGDLFPGKTKSRRIHYSVYQWGKIELFVKRAPKLRLNPRMEKAVNRLNSPFFQTPMFLGSWHSGGLEFAVWERLDHPWLPRFEAMTLDGLFRIVDAIVAVNAATGVVTRADPGVRRGTLWMRPFTGEPRSEPLARLEPEILARFAELGDRFFSHNDIAFHNILEAEPPVLVDWELGTVGVAGASLRGFATLDQETQLRLAKRYAARMSAEGHPVRTRDAYFVMGAMQVYFWLASGKIEQALAAVPGHIASRL